MIFDEQLDVFQTPNGHSLASSGYHDDHFYVLVPNPPDGGSYTCQVPAVQGCIHNNHSATASLTLDKLDARLIIMDATTQAKVAALEAKDAALEAKDAALEAKDAALEAKEAALEAKDTALEAKVAALEGELGKRTYIIEYLMHAIGFENVINRYPLILFSTLHTPAELFILSKLYIGRQCRCI
jgi:hypothetical protein